jgi:hypothetical protein
MRMESKMSKMETKVSIDLGIARGKKIKEVRGDQAFTPGKREPALKPQKPQYYILDVLHMPCIDCAYSSEKKVATLQFALAFSKAHLFNYLTTLESSPAKPHLSLLPLHSGS